MVNVCSVLFCSLLCRTCLKIAVTSQLYKRILWTESLRGLEIDVLLRFDALYLPSKQGHLVLLSKAMSKRSYAAGKHFTAFWWRRHQLQACFWNEFHDVECCRLFCASGHVLGECAHVNVISCYSKNSLKNFLLRLWWPCQWAVECTNTTVFNHDCRVLPADAPMSKCAVQTSLWSFSILLRTCV